MKKKTKRITKKSEKNKDSFMVIFVGLILKDIALGANDVVIFLQLKHKNHGCWKEWN